MANIMRFVILGDDRGGPAFASFTKQVEKANMAVDRNNAALKRQSKAAQDARGGIAALAGDITGFGAAADAAGAGGNKFRLALAGINLATGVLEPALAGVVVAAGGLAAGFAAAGAGIGVFGAVAKSVFAEASKGATAYATAQQKYASATTSAQRVTALKAEKAAFAGMTPPVKALALQLGDTQKRWKAFTNAAAPGVVGVISKGLGLLPKILSAMKPFLAPVEKALRGIIGQLNTGLSSAGFTSFIGALAKNTGPAITKIAAAIGNVVVGIGGILKAFLPTSQSLLSGIDKITAKFRVWGTTLSGHTGFASLMATFRTETPQAVAILKNLGVVIGNVGKAMFGLSTFSNSRLLLNLLTPLSGVMASLSKNTNLVRVALYALAAVKIGQQFSWVRDAWKGIVKFAAVTEGATAAEVIAAAATRAWGIAMDALPWVALAAAVVAVAVLIIKYHRQIWAFVQRVWHDVLAVIMGVWHWVQQHWPLLLAIITGPIGLAILWIVRNFGRITAAVKAVLGAVSRAWNAVWNTLKGAFRLFIVNGILTPLGWIIHGAASAFGWIPGLGGKLKGAAKAFDAFKANVNRSLGGINGRTVRVGVAMTSSTNPYPGGISGRKASGGLITGPGGPRDDRAGLYALSNNEWVIRADSAARYGHAAMAAVNEGRAYIGYAGGGVAVKASAPGYAAVESSLMGSVTKLAKAFAKASESVGGMVSYRAGGGVAQWAGVILRALGMLGQSPGWLGTVERRMNQESGGNPNIVNKWDSNWLAGHPSVGLMQVIAGTFRAFAGQFRGTGPFSYGVSVNPLANTYAGLRYALDTYGSLSALNRPGGYASGTRGAAPGWAWVGERGPELVLMRGGEEVIPARASRLMMKLIPGYASGTSAVLPAAVARDIPRYAATIHKLLRDLLAELKLQHRTEPAWVRRLIAAGESRLTRLAGERQNVAGRIAAARSYAAQKTQDFAGYAGLAGVIGATSPDAVSAAAISAGLAQKLRNLNDFNSAIRGLKNRHLSGALIRQIIEMGPDDGLAYARAILESPGITGQLNATQAAISRAAAATGRTSADVLYDTGKNASKGFLTGLLSQQRQIDAAMRTVAARMIRELRKALRIHSPSAAMAEIGTYAAAGYRFGWTREMTKAVTPVAVPAGAGAGGGSGGGNTYSITVNVPPTANLADVGRRTVEAIRAYEQGSGSRWRR